jgi:branched-chain amino acid transport system substrate-binding protein
MKSTSSRLPGRRVLGALAAAILATGLVACGSSSNSGSSNSGSSGAGTDSAAPFVIGYDGPLSEACCSYNGLGHLDGLKGWAHYVNAHGGIDGHQVKIDALDDATDVQQAQSHFIQFKDEIKPSAVTDMDVSTTGDALLPLFEGAKIPMITVSGIPATNGNYSKYPYVWLTGPTFAAEGAVLAEAVHGLVGSSAQAPRIAILDPEDPDGTAFASVVEQKMQAYGWGKPVYTGGMPVTSPLTNMLPIAQAIKSAHATYVLGTLFGSYSTELMQALTQVGYSGRVVSTVVGGSYATLKQINSPNYYASSPFSYLEGSSADIAVVKSSTVAAGGSTSYDTLVSAGWAMGAVTGAALKLCGYPCPGPKMEQALQRLNDMPSPQGTTEGPIGFSDGSHYGVQIESLYHYVNGSLQKVLTGLKVPNLG